MFHVKHRKEVCMNYQETLDYLSNFSKAKKIEYINKQIKKANKQMERIEKADIYSQGYERALADIGKGNRFKTLRKNASNFNIEKALADVTSFTNSDSYYIKDIRQNMKTIRENLADKSDVFQFKNQKDVNKFYKILHSNEFSRAQKLGILDSSTEMDEIKESLLKGASIEQIQNALQEFATSELTVDEFQNLVEKNKGTLSKNV